MNNEKNNPLITEGWSIFSDGDHSVGIPDGRWTLTGTMYFNDLEEKEEFRTEIAKAFELVCDPVTYVKTIEEEAAMYKAEQDHYARMDKDFNGEMNEKP